MIGPELDSEVLLEVEVAYALPDRQAVIPLHVPQGTTVMEAILLSGIAERFRGLDPQNCQVGVYGRVVDPGQLLETGQRVEIYRPLVADPKTARRELAATGKTMGATGASRSGR